MSPERTQPDKGRSQKLYWQYDGMSAWDAIRLDKYDNEIEVCSVEVETMERDEEGKFVVWVKQRGVEGKVRPRRGPLKGAFVCLCSAMKACEAHYA